CREAHLVRLAGDDVALVHRARDRALRARLEERPRRDVLDDEPELALVSSSDAAVVIVGIIGAARDERQRTGDGSDQLHGYGPFWSRGVAMQTARHARLASFSRSRCLRVRYRRISAAP